MPRNNHMRPQITLALSPSAAALALGIKVERINEAIDEGRLEIRQLFGKKKVPVFGELGLQAFFESFPRATRKVPRC